MRPARVIEYECGFHGGRWVVDRQGRAVFSGRSLAPARSEMGRRARGEAEKDGVSVRATYRPVGGTPVVDEYGQTEPDGSPRGEVESDPEDWPAWTDEGRWVPTQTPVNAGHPRRATAAAE